MVGYKGRAGYGGDKASQVDLYKFKVGNEEILGVGQQCGTKGQGEMSEGYSVYNDGYGESVIIYS
jgi:hypothetical protein